MDAEIDPQTLRKAITALSPEVDAPASVIRILKSVATDASLEQVELSVTDDRNMLWSLSIDETTEFEPLVTIRSTTPSDLSAWIQQNLNGTSI